MGSVRCMLRGEDQGEQVRLEWVGGRGCEEVIV